MNDCISKPVQLEDLAEILRKYTPAQKGKKVPPKRAEEASLDSEMA
ncbi:MAG: hypothetical protein LUQ38_07100 [Methanotrichaceae archaeon]|nr:hypothetical protein [Methanotrichaceae archaeon]MDD1758550.1 hypothetical protein [Methanotrichaceae archaeon]